MRLYGPKQTRSTASPPAGQPPSDALSPVPSVHSGETSSWCPGCGHGSLSLMIAEAIAAHDLQERVVLSVGVGCGSTLPQQLHVHSVATPHGRASDVATGLSRMLPDRVVVQYSGDGDACAIGLAGLLHACHRKENFIVFIYNNNVYGMTGGQIGPTTSAAVPTTTFPNGRPEEVMGYPLDIMDMLRHLPGVAYAARCSTSSSKRLLSARKVIDKAFRMHLAGVRGMKVVDVMGNCNVNWKGGGQTFTPLTANQLIEDKILASFPLGEVRVTDDFR